MIAKLLELATGKGDLERVAYKGDQRQLNEYLKTRRVLIPKRPKRFLDAATFTQDELLQLIKEESEELASDHMSLWVLDLEGKKRLPVFSSHKKMQEFSGKISKKLNQVFALGCVEVLLADGTKGLDIDFVDLNLFNQKSWEITMRKTS